MKKLIALLLALITALSLAACSSENPYDAYEDIFELLDDGEYDKAIALIEEMKDPEDGEKDSQGESSDSPDNDSSGDNGPVNSEEPDADTKALLDLYNSIAYALSTYDPDSTFYIYTANVGSLYGQNALKYCYEALQELECLDEWLAKGYADENVNPDRLALLTGFSRVQDVLLTATVTTEDQMGNVDTKGANVWRYDAEGRPTVYTPDAFAPYGELYDLYGYRGYDYALSYDEQGRVASVKIIWPVTDELYCVVTPTYDANGRKTTESLKTNSGTVTYTYSYDNQGRLIRIHIPVSDTTYRTLTYTYDAAGDLQKKIWTEYTSSDRMYASTTTEYTWKAGTCSATVTTTHWNATSQDGGSYSYSVESEAIDTVTYEYENGRVVREITEFGATVYTDGRAALQPGVISKTLEFVYSDYYIYSPDQE